jgi:polyisoprenoid-binding protein YceI
MKCPSIVHAGVSLKLSALCVLSILLGLAFAAPAADTYKIDPAHSTVGFSVKHMVINKVKGKFTDFTGTLVLDSNAIQEAKGTIQTKSVDTGIGQRDTHLCSPDFFDVSKYPTITFTTKRVEKHGEDTVLVGDYTMHGVTKELSLPATLSGPIKDPMGSTRIGLEARAKLNRKDYGLTYSKALETGGMIVGDEIEIEINAEAVKQ